MNKNIFFTPTPLITKAGRCPFSLNRFSHKIARHRHGVQMHPRPNLQFPLNHRSKTYTGI